MECLYPKECINAESHLDSKIKKRSRDISIESSIEIPNIEKLNIKDSEDLVVHNSKKIKIDTYINKDCNIKFNSEINNKITDNSSKNDKVLLKIESIEKKLRLFKMCSTKYIDHLQDELDELKNIM